MTTDLEVAAAPVTKRKPRRLARAAASLVVGFAVWIPLVHVFFTPGEARLPELARELAKRHVRLWTDPAARGAEVGRMRAANNEWDFMGRTFLACALLEMAAADPALKKSHLEVVDRIIDETIGLEREKGIHFFLLDYSRWGDFVVQPPGSIFVDGEVALMIGLRRLVEERADYKALLEGRVRKIEDRMRRGPVLCGESYPDECWIFCNTVALAALRVSDVLDGTDHRSFFQEWVRVAREKLTDRASGILVSSFTVGGRHRDGPEGSSIWFAAHCLRLVDADFARDQFERARRELARGALGFAWAREWPRSWNGPADIDSGPIVPIVEASAGSSGLALVGASSFGDRELLRSLVASLELAGFPHRCNGELSYAASNQVGDAVLLYALTLGPLWNKVGAP